MNYCESANSCLFLQKVPKRTVLVVPPLIRHLVSFCISGLSEQSQVPGQRQKDPLLIADQQT